MLKNDYGKKKIAMGTTQIAKDCRDMMLLFSSADIFFGYNISRHFHQILSIIGGKMFQPTNNFARTTTNLYSHGIGGPKVVTPTLQLITASLLT